MGPMSMELLLESVPAEAVYRRSPLAAAQNALECWQQAVERFVKPDDERDFWGALVYGTDAADEGALLLGSEGQRVRALLARNAEAMRLLDAGVDRGHFQFPEFHDFERLADASKFASKLGELARLPLIHAKILSAEGDLVAAAEEVFRLLVIGEMICGGDGQMLHYLIGLWIRSAALRSIGRLGAQPDIPRPVLDELLHAVERSLRVPDGLAQSLRVDFCTVSLPQLDRTSDEGGLETVVDKLLAAYYSPHAPPAEEVGLADTAELAADWVAWRRQQILALLAGHPRPFDKAATARLMGTLTARIVREARYAEQFGDLTLMAKLHRLRRQFFRHRLQAKTRFWPVELTPGFPYGTVGRGNPPSGVQQTAASALDARGLLTERRLAAARERLHKIPNPIGLILVEHLATFDYSPFMFQHRTVAGNIRGLLAQRAAEMDKQRRLRD